MEIIEYKGYSIQQDWPNPYSKEPEYMFYPTEQGAQHDADCTDGESFTYCGNCKWESSVENCMFEIDALINSMDTVELWNITSTKRVYTFDVEAELVKFREFWKGEPGKEVLNCYI